MTLPHVLRARLAARSGPLSRRQRILAGFAGAAVIAAVISAVLLAWPQPAAKRLTAYFPETAGLYTGDRVVVLGVPVGQVDSVTPQHGRVRVEMSYDAHVKIPSGAEAAIITPTLVSTRSVQLSPAYRRGAVLADGAVISEPRTAVPVEWDQIEQELNTLATAFGPHGGTTGALNRMLGVAAANLNGRGRTMHDTLDALAQASTTLSDDRGDLFATLANLRQFITVLAQVNGQVGSFEQRLASVSGVLADNRHELAATLSALNSSAGTVTRFVRSNRGALSAGLASADSVVANLARSDQAVADILQGAPTALANVNNVYNPIDHSLSGALALTNLQNPAEFVCSTIFSAGGTPAQCQQALGPYLGLLRLDSAPVSADPVNRNGYGGRGTSGSGGLVNLLLGGGGS